MVVLTEKQKKLIESNWNLLFSYYQKEKNYGSIPSFLDDVFKSDLYWNFCLSALKYDEELGYKFSTYAYGGFRFCSQRLCVEKKRFIKNNYVDDRTIKFLIKKQETAINHEEQYLDKNAILSLLDDTNFTSTEKLILITYFFENRTFSKIGDVFKLSRSRIQQILEIIKNKLRRSIVRKNLCLEDFYI
jgi:RNA polymerase sigma factor (sigma-70 family)